MKQYYKVVTHNNNSLGLRKNPNILNFPIGISVYEHNDLDYSNNDYGGIWVTQTLSGARGLVRYMMKKSIKENNPILSKVIIYKCEIGEILYENSYRVKTDKVKLIDTIKIY